jgi:hypothetical protein
MKTWRQECGQLTSGEGERKIKREIQRRWQGKGWANSKVRKMAHLIEAKQQG